MSLVLFFCVASGAAAVGWFAGRRAARGTRQGATPHALVAGSRAQGPDDEARPRAPDDPLEAFPFRPGDVLVRGRVRPDEILLTGALRLDEDGRPVAAIFVGQGDRARPRAVLCLPAPADEVRWLAEIDPPEASPGDAAQGSLLLDGALFERTRRLPVVVGAFGGASALWCGDGLLAEYRGDAGRVAVTLVVGERRLVALGDVARLDEIDRLPGH